MGENFKYLLLDVRIELCLDRVFFEEVKNIDLDIVVRDREVVELDVDKILDLLVVLVLFEEVASLEDVPSTVAHERTEGVENM